MINKRCIYSIVLSALGLIATTNILLSCTDDDVITQKSDHSLITIQASLATTRMAYEGENSKELTWSDGDAFRFFNDESAGTTFTLTNGAGSSNATFTGTSTTGMNRAFYPASNTNIGYAIGYANLTLPFYGQKQNGNAQTNNLTQYTYMMAETTSSTPSHLTFAHLAAQIKFELTLPQGYQGNIKKLELLLPPGENHFIADLCPSDQTKNVMTHRQSLSLSNVTIGSDRVLRAYMMMAPTTLTSQNLTIAITTSGEEVNYYYAEANNISLQIEAGHQYLVKYALQAVGEKYPASNYQLSSNGDTLTHWNTYTSTAQAIDMTKDIHLRKVISLSEDAFANRIGDNNYNRGYFSWIQLPDHLRDINFDGFVYIKDTTGKTQIGVGPEADDISGYSSQLCHLSWNVSKDNNYYTDKESHLLSKNGDLLVNISLPTTSNSTVEIPEGVISLDRYSINTATNISRLVLPSTISNIDSYAFGWTKTLNELVVPQTNPNSIEVTSNSFYSAMYNSTKLVVPTGSSSAYATHSVWKLFSSVSEDDIASDFTIDIPSASRSPYLITKQLGYLYTVDKDSYTLPLELSKNIQWTAKSNADWVSLSASAGSSKNGTTLQIAANTSDSWRYATVTVTAGGSTQMIRIQQQPVNHILPVVLHILKDGSTNTEGFTTAMGKAFIDSLNNRYEHTKNYNSQGMVINTFDTHIRLQLATNDPDGNPTSGVIMEQVDNANVDPHDFLNFDYPNSEQDKKDHSLLWPQNKYINIFLFEFVDNDGDENTYIAGVSNLAYMRPDVDREYLGNFYTLDYGYDFNNLNSMQSVTLNSVLMYDADGNGPTVNTDLVNTAIHEIGHYLSLHHTFDDGPGTNGDDGVSDTPNYDRDTYVTFASQFWDYYDEYTALQGTGSTASAFFPDRDALVTGYYQIFWRLPKNSASEYAYDSHASDAFKGSNIMDYYYFWDDIQGFTAGQVERMRYAIAHSPTIPHEGYSTRSVKKVKFEPNPDIEIHTSVCPPLCTHHNHHHATLRQ